MQIVSGFVLMPFTLAKLGHDQYGTWLLITSLTSYLSLLALGVPMATVRFVAKFAVGSDEEGLNRVVCSCFGLYLIIGAISLVVGIVLFVVFSTAYDIPAEFRGRAQLAFGLVVLAYSGGFLGQLPYGIMSAYDDFVVRNRLQTASLVLRALLTFAILAVSQSLVWLAIILGVALVFDLALAMYVIRRRYPRIRLRLKDFDVSAVREIFSFSMYVLVLNVAGQLAFQTDSLVIGAFRPVGDIPYFSVASSLATYLMQFVVAIGAVVMPMATRYEAQGRMDELRDVFLKWSKITFSLTLLVGLFLIFLGPSFIAWWVGSSFERPSGDVLRILMVANLVFLPMRGVALPILMGLGRPKAPTIGFLILSVGNLGLSILLARPLGLNGVAYGTAIPNVFYAAFLLVIACRSIGVGTFEYLKYVGVRASVGALVASGALWLMMANFDIHGLIPLFVAGLAFVAVFGAVWGVLVYRNDRYIPLSDALKRVPIFNGVA